MSREISFDYFEREGLFKAGYFRAGTPAGQVDDWNI